MNQTIELECSLFSISISMNETVEKPCIIVFRTISVMPPIYVKRSVTYYAVLLQFLSHARQSITVFFVDVQPGFLQLLLTQTGVKCTSLNPSTCVVYYSGI